ncbi:type III toxin-antitoxin system ToxN/AbiQ family toxin [Lachnospiraceae bacterium OttesenSCG-928-E19]|nr:type III toxin-antitoxin system ToxN/AbiQ family toxin [Lachnospiraceae bacterium OttesenSCG-928-E19]
MQFYNITDSYITYLKTFDNTVSDNKVMSRPYVGIVLEINEVKYFAPFSSPKPKHQRMKNGKDFRKINGGIYGAINLNNMIPVVDNALIKIDINNLVDVQYKRLLQNQYNCIRSDKIQIQNVATKLHALIFTDDANLTAQDLKVKQRCCNLPVLETASKSYRQYLDFGLGLSQ